MNLERLLPQASRPILLVIDSSISGYQRQLLLRGNSQSMSHSVTDPLPTTEDTACWSGVFAMSLCVFVLIASEFMPVSLLTPIASSLQITEGMAGQGIAISGILAVVTSLLIPVLAGKVNRKTLLLGLTGLMGISGLIIGLSDSYASYLLGRALIGVVIGGFWSMSAAIAMRLVPSEQVPKALAIFNGGNALAMILAAPLGAYLGSLLSWRGAFLCLLPIAVITLIWQWLSLPSMPVRERSARIRGTFAVLGLLRTPVVLAGMLAIASLFMGQFALFTYVRPFLESVTQVAVKPLSLILLLIGLAGLIGTSLINGALKRQFYLTLKIMPLLMAVSALGLAFFGTQLILVIVLLLLWGLIATAAPVGWWAWVPRTIPQSAETAGGLMVAVIQLSIALGSTLGGVLFDIGGHQLCFGISALLLLLSTALVGVTQGYETPKSQKDRV